MEVYPFKVVRDKNGVTYDVEIYIPGPEPSFVGTGREESYAEDWKKEDYIEVLFVAEFKGWDPNNRTLTCNDGFTLFY